MMEDYNIIINGGDFFAARKNKNIDNLIWYVWSDKVFMSKKDLFLEAQEQLAAEGYKLTLQEFGLIDRQVKLSRFDLASAYRIVCKAVRKKKEVVLC